MRVNIENLLRNENSSLPSWGFITHLKELRRRTLRGDMKALDEFFAIYIFDNDQEADRTQKGVPGMWAWECQTCGATGTSEEEPGSPCGAEIPEELGGGECDGKISRVFVPNK